MLDRILVGRESRNPKSVAGPGGCELSYGFETALFDRPEYGEYGPWALATTYPEVFAAAVPICGRVNLS